MELKCLFKRRFKFTGKRTRKISEELKLLYPGLRGLSAMSVHWFCISHYIHKTARLDDYYVDRIVSVNICILHTCMSID